MSGSKNDHGPLVVGGEPRIDFLPTETKKRKENRRQRRSLVALVFMVAVVCVLAVIGSRSIAVASQVALDAEREKTTDLINQQKEFAAARTAAAELQSATDARLVGSATEVMWRKLIREIVEVLPEGTAFLNASAKSVSALESIGSPDILLQEHRLAQVIFQVDALDLAHADAAVLAIRKLDSFADATAYTITRDETTGYYRLVITLNLGEKALERRFFINPLPEDEPTDDEEPTDEATPTPTPTPTTTGVTPTPTSTNETEG